MQSKILGGKNAGDQAKDSLWVPCPICGKKTRTKVYWEISVLCDTVYTMDGDILSRDTAQTVILILERKYQVMNGTDLLKALWCIDPTKFAEANQESDQKSAESNAPEEKQE